MRKFLTVALAFLLTGTVGFAQLTGTIAIPGTYASLSFAIAELNAQGVGPGGVIFNISAGYTETFSDATAGTITTTTGSESNPILFQKYGSGPNPVITAAALSGTAVMDGIIKIIGTDYVTFEGIDVVENPLNTSNKTEWGYAILSASSTNASQHIQIRSCAITLDKTNTSSRGVYSAHHNATSTTVLTPSNTLGVISYCDIDNCSISNVYTGIYFNGYNAPTPYSLYGQNNRFGYTNGNTITNFGGGALTPSGIYTIYQNNLTVANNIINDGGGTTTGLNGIYISTAQNANVNIYRNRITLTSSTTGSSSLMGIYNAGGSTGTSNTINIYENVLENCTQPSVGTGAFYMIYNSASAMVSNVYKNTIRNNSRPSALSTVYLIYLSSATSVGTENVYENDLYGNSVTTTGSSQFYGIYCLNPSVRKNIYLNNIYNNYTASTSTITGIISANGTIINIYRNNVHDQTINSTTGVNNGLRITSGANVYCYNNQFSDLKAPASSSVTAIRGIVIESSASNIGLYYNTIFLNGSGSGTDFGSACVHTTTFPTLDMRNNILVNTSIPIGAGKSIAYWRANTSLSNYPSLSGNNGFYAGTPGPQNLIFYDGTNSIQTLAEYKLLVAPADVNSFTEMPPFLNTTTTPYDLQINPEVPTQCESGGVSVSTPIGITNDFTDIPRFPNAGYPNNPAHTATAPDAGAYEFAGITIDLNPPVISYSPLPNTSLLTNRTLTATINDASGVPASGIGLPVCYWKINDGSYSPSQGTPVTGTNNYTFTFGVGVALGDVVSYYIVAQDVVIPPNVVANPFAGTSGVTANPPACAVPPTVPKSYTIINSINGAFTVGTEGDYPSLTGPGGLFQDLNSKVLTGDITASIVSNLTEAGTYGLNKLLEDPPGNFTVTIQPNAGIERLIEGNVANTMIRFNGAQRVTIDGRFNGSGKYLRFRNTDLTHGNLELSNDASYNTLRDCYWESGNTSTDNTTIGTIRIYLPAGITGNSNNLILNNVIRDFTQANGQPYTGIFSMGIASSYNINNSIIGNEIYNFTTYGLYLSAGNGDNWTVTGNSFYNNLSVPLTTSLRAINFNSGTTNYGHNISGNYIGGSAPMCGGTPWVLNSTGTLYGMYVSAGTTPSSEVYGNVISNFHNISTGAGSFYAIYFPTTGIFHCGTLGGNVIGSSTTPNSIVFDGTMAFRGIYQQGNSPDNTIENNVVGNITWSAASGTQTGIYGLYVSFAQVRKNKVFNIGTSQSGFTPTIYGIYNAGAAGGTNEFSNNIIDLDGGAATNPTLYGFWDNAPATGVTNLYFNTIYIHGLATTTSSSYVWRRNVGAINELKDNIFFNNRDAGGSGNHYAVYNFVATTLLTDYNDIFASAGPLGYTGGSNVISLSDWQTATSGDAHSVSVNPDFISVSDLHPANPALDNTGIAIAGVIKDYSGFTRGNPPDMGALEFPAMPGSINVIGTIGSTMDTCYNALNTITVGGEDNAFNIQPGGVVTMIAGQNIIYHYGTVVEPGGYLHGYITTDGQYCNSQPPANPVTTTETWEPFLNSKGQLFTIYPNPTSGNFTIMLKEETQTDKLKIEIYTMQGKKVLTEEMTGEQRHEFNLSEMPAGLYFVKIVLVNTSEIIKLVKTR